jgi:plastocyanin
MPAPSRSLVCLSALFVVAACSGDTAVTTDPVSLARGGIGVKRIEMLDACDPTTFNAAIGPGTCVRAGGVRFDHFIRQIDRHQSVGAWHFAPGKVNARVGQTLLAVNQGGEVHSFTEVEEFGGGIVPDLNDLLGLEPTPECLAAAVTGESFVAPGGTFEDEVEEVGSERYQCCIHPWMRAVVTAKR